MKYAILDDFKTFLQEKYRSRATVKQYRFWVARLLETQFFMELEEIDFDGMLKALETCTKNRKNADIEIHENGDYILWFVPKRGEIDKVTISSDKHYLCEGIAELIRTQDTSPKENKTENYNNVTDMENSESTTSNRKELNFDFTDMDL